MNRIVLAHAAAAAAALSAGAAVVATRFVIGETDPLPLVFYRYVISIACFAPVMPMLWPKQRLLASEYARIAAFVRAGFEIYNPADALVDKCAIYQAPHHFSIDYAGDSVFGVRILMRGENPAAAAAGADACKGLANPLCRRFEIGRRDARMG